MDFAGRGAPSAVHRFGHIDGCIRGSALRNVRMLPRTKHESCSSYTNKRWKNWKFSCGCLVAKGTCDSLWFSNQSVHRMSSQRNFLFATPTAVYIYFFLLFLFHVFFCWAFNWIERIGISSPQIHGTRTECMHFRVSCSSKRVEI